MGEMQPQSDAQLLRAYAEHGNEPAFTELVQRHTNLVYSAALRQVEVPATAAEISQNVFVSLARDAKNLGPKLTSEASLAGWLCRSARNLSLNHRRDEFRRVTRERHAMEQLLSTSDAAPDWDKLRRVLDDAMAELNETDHDALVLRFYQNQDFHTVGTTIGVSDDTAQKRVARALDKLRNLLAQRGIRATTTTLGVVITANAVQAAPVGLALTISAAALAGTAVTTSTVIAATTKTIVMTTLQKTLVTTTIAVVAGFGIYEARQAAQLRDQVQTLQRQQTALTEEIQQLQEDKNQATNRLSAVAAEIEKARSASNELLRLRGEITVLRRESKPVTENLKPQPAKEPNPPQTEFTRENWRFAGFETPENTLQSSAWAMRQDDAAGFLASLTPEFRAWLGAGSGSQDKMVIEGLNGISLETKSYRITSVQTNSANEHILFVYYSDAYGNSRGNSMLLKRIEGQWKIGRLTEQSPKRGN